MKRVVEARPNGVWDFFSDSGPHVSIKPGDSIELFDPGSNTTLVGLVVQGRQNSVDDLDEVMLDRLRTRLRTLQRLVDGRREVERRD